MNSDEKIYFIDRKELKIKLYKKRLEKLIILLSMYVKKITMKLCKKYHFQYVIFFK